MTLKENYNVRTHDDIYAMKKEKNSEQEKLYCFINIYITHQVTIKLSIYGTTACSDRSANNKCEGLFSGLRDIWIAV